MITVNKHKQFECLQTKVWFIVREKWEVCLTDVAVWCIFSSCTPCLVSILCITPCQNQLLTGHVLVRILWLQYTDLITSLLRSSWLWLIENKAVFANVSVKPTVKLSLKWLSKYLGKEIGQFLRTEETARTQAALHSSAAKGHNRNGGSGFVTNSQNCASNQLTTEMPDI